MVESLVLKRLSLIVLCAVLSAAPLRAEVKERDWSESAQPKANAAAGDASRPTLNITQPDLQVDHPTYLLAPKSSPDTVKKRKKRKKSARRKLRSKTKKTTRKSPRQTNDRVELESWWKQTGNPVVMGFSQCLHQDALRYRELAGSAPAHVQIARAMDGACRREFDEMAQTIADRFGNDGFEKLSEELIRTTFVPAVEAIQ